MDPIEHCNFANNLRRAIDASNNVPFQPSKFLI